MKISIVNYPFFKSKFIRKLKFNGGPYIFLDKLTDSIKKQKLFKLSNTYLNNNLVLYLGGAKNIANKKFVVRLDAINFDIKDKLRRVEQHKIIKSNVDHSLGVIFQSIFCKDLYENFFGKIDKPYEIIHNGIPLDEFTSAGSDMRDNLNIKKDDFVIISSARWRRHKRLNETIEFFNLIKTKDNNNLKLIILGKHDLDKSNYEDIIFAGDIDYKDLPKWYRTGNMFLHLSWIEPAGNSHLEAIGCGLPVLCANNGGMVETVKSSNGGIISNTDKIFNLNLIDFYNPPKPNYEILYNDFLKIQKNYKHYRKNINLNEIDIDKIAKKYFLFLKKITHNIK